MSKTSEALNCLSLSRSCAKRGAVVVAFLSVRSSHASIMLRRRLDVKYVWIFTGAQTAQRSYNYLTPMRNGYLWECSSYVALNGRFTCVCRSCNFTETIMILECGPMPNLMVALPNIGGALCSTPQRLADAHY